MVLHTVSLSALVVCVCVLLILYSGSTLSPLRIMCHNWNSLFHCERCWGQLMVVFLWWALSFVWSAYDLIHYSSPTLCIKKWQFIIHLNLIELCQWWALFYNSLADLWQPERKEHRQAGIFIGSADKKWWYDDGTAFPPERVWT